MRSEVNVRLQNENSEVSEMYKEGNESEITNQYRKESMLSLER